jgi:hypothetical protein
MSAYNILNTKYIIRNPQSKPLTNPHALGSAWFAEDIKLVTSGAEELEALGQHDLSFTTIVHDEFSSQVQALDLASPSVSSDKIELTEISPNKLKYSANVNQDRLAVFSEIWYPHGWQATIDGNEAEYIRANYLLRAMVIPSGQHEIEFKFVPKSLKTGQLIALIGSILVVLLLLGWAYTEISKKKATDPSRT